MSDRGRVVRTAIGAAVIAAGLAAAATWAAAGAQAAGAAAATAPSGGERMFATECGACHWAYPPLLLPARSWSALTGHLTNHFGEDASLDADTTRQIADFLAARAGDAPGVNSPFLRGLRSEDVPLLITDLPVWKAIHGRIPASEFASPEVKSSANCLGCHRG